VSIVSNPPSSGLTLAAGLPLISLQLMTRDHPGIALESGKLIVCRGCGLSVTAALSTGYVGTAISVFGSPSSAGQPAPLKFSAGNKLMGTTQVSLYFMLTPTQFKAQYHAHL
jgi:hypothetical protein